MPIERWKDISKKNIKNNIKKYERETLRETFYAIQDAVLNKKAHYDGRKIKWESYRSIKR